MFKTDLEIAQECKMEHIRDIAAKIGVGEEDLEYYGNYKAKVSLDLLHRNEGKEDGKLILVTAINPTKAGEGKSNDCWFGGCVKPAREKDDDRAS